ncbi:MAG: gephyrin-like molybdotransferase Glp [Oliverpabstia sp.]
MQQNILLEQAIELICERTEKHIKMQKVPVEEAGGFCLAEDIYADLDNPPFPRSPVDGYAVNHSDLMGASRENPISLRVTGCIYAGDDGEAQTIQKGEAMRIMTGAPFPKGSDAAVRQEDTDEGETVVRIYQEQQPYSNYCFQGEDYKKGELLLEKGSRITFAEQGILSGIGRTSVAVYKKPVIRVFTTGDEVCQPGKPLVPGKIYNSNGMMVSARLKELGVKPAEVTHVADDETVLAKALGQACQDADIIVTTGGVSVGKRDILHGTLELLGAEKVFWRVAVQPGSPSIYSVYRDTQILSLSGNPFGAMANLELLLRPMLHKMTGDSFYAMKKQEGILTEGFPKKSKMRRFVRAFYENGKVSLSKGIFSSGAIGTLRGCNCLLDIPAETGQLQEGEKVNLWML